ncbi:ATP-binding protein [Shewanella submarina]|uniref:histidine kinase n=1 Tax=Shewanella submarina TaxID=2016376 RepID=A0ABV7GGI2_9GAMM|nr:ATP-binding protein [Shewanella submarina]MCL1036146.1 ATP-binding protein [Shewanella submarina]
MRRLFISLYLLMSLTIIGLGWTLETLWESNIKEHSADHAPLLILADTLAQLPQPQREQVLQQAVLRHQLPMVLLPGDAVALNNEQNLQPGKILTTVNERDQQRQFLVVDDQVLMVGPVELNKFAHWQAAYTLSFYVLLALGILLWIRPLSRDIKSLEQVAIEFGKANWRSRVQLPKSSQVLQLGNTFNQMAGQISTLIENQKHMSNAVSHEIRTPLARLKFAIALLPSYCKPEKSAEDRDAFLQDMREDVKEIDTLLAEMLTYASLESNGPDIQHEEADLVVLCRQLVLRLEPLSATPVVFDSEVASLIINGEPALMERAIQNLITNAQRYAKTQIRVTLSVHKQRVRVSVADDGVGIPTEEQQKIFDPYYRSKQNRNEDKGYGLGLAIVARIMQRASGKVTVKSEPGNTCFSLFWPLP